MQGAWERFKATKHALGEQWFVLHEKYSLQQSEPLPYDKEKELTSKLLKRFSDIT